MAAVIEIRAASEDDAELLFSMIMALAEYERSPESVRGTPELLREGLFGEHPEAEALIAECDGERVGFALFHGSYSTWHCRPGIWLEDLFVMPEHRRHGIGQQLLRQLAKIAVERGCTRLNWTALDWNAPALSFYEKIGAQALGEWVNHRLSDEALAAFAAGDGPRQV